MRKKILVMVAVVAALAVVSQAAFGAVTATFTGAFKPNKANKPTGVSVKYNITDPAAPQPPINNRVQISFPSGGKWNGKKFPKCTASKLNASGPKGCPSKSKIGTGTGVGYAKPVVTDPVNGKLTIFNGGNSVLVYVFPDLGPTFVVTCNVVGGYNLSCAIPPIKTLPSAPDAAVGAVSTKVGVKKKGKLGMLVTPKKCKGSWKYTAKFSFTTGETVTAPGTQKCKK